MYATSTASTTSGSSRAIASSAGDRRVRVVRLLRPRRSAPAFGFSLRGGKEYATGFFITKVDFNSEAHLQGLKVGDQLVSVNGYRVDDAVHSELVHYLASQSRLKIKVRHVGMLPVKDKAHDGLSWQFISERSSLGSDVSPSPTLCHDTERLTDLRLSILVPPRAKLGCGICKGPDWKPGIFVQFVRDGGIAREAGLRPGDQILSCNGQDFANVPFNEAISAMKVAGRLELIVREGAGTELVSPESSGYNSSASSAAGEKIPPPPGPAAIAPPVPAPAALRRRLASVAEEAADRADRLAMSRIKRRTWEWDSLEFEWKMGDMHNFDAPSDIEPDYDCPSIPNNPHSYDNKTQSHSLHSTKEFVTRPSNRTIINLTEDGATIQCSYDNRGPKKPTSNTIPSRESEKKTIVVEVHHSSNNGCGKSHCNYPTPVKDCKDTAILVSSNTLSNAIAEEIQRRKLNKKNSTETNPPNHQHHPVKAQRAVPNGVDDSKKKQHDALIDEFKKVHRKMFAGQEKNNSDTTDNGHDAHSLDRQQTLPLRIADKELTAADTMTNSHGHSQPKPKRENGNIPPPPPPMPATNGHQNGNHHNDTEDLTTTPTKLNFNLKSPNFRQNGTLTRTPTPDYLSNSKTDSISVKSNNVRDEKAELESIESFKLRSPSNGSPKPPSNYFVSAPNGTATMKKHGRPVSVTIGEYASAGAGSKRQPTKLDFLNGDKPEGDGPHPEEVSITNRLQSELVMTLSRSNLRKKTEAINDDNKLIPGDENLSDDGSLDKHFHARYGNNILPLPPSISIPKVTKLKH